MSSLKNLRSLNLNQLPILRELLRQENITRAAEILNLSQPAVSNVLKTLRGHFGDELLVREGTTMSRTTKGEELLVFLETALTHIESAIIGSDFDAASATGPVRIATVDNVIGTVAAPVCKILESEAPELAVQFVIASHSLAHDLKSGSVDIAVTSTEFLDSSTIPVSLRDELHTQFIGAERLVGIGRAGDPHIAEGLSLDAYMSRPHASYVVDPDHPHTVERQHIRNLKLRRSTRIATSSNQSLPAIVANSDCLAIVPLTLAKMAERHYPIQIFKPPMDLPDIQWVVAWHGRVSDVPLIQWSIDAILRCSKDIESRFR